MVQLSVVPDDRRERARDQKRRSFLLAASRVIDRDGLAGLTMQAVADQLDCAVGTIYGYFPSKAALLSALQDDAIDTLLGSYRTGRAAWVEVLAGDELEPELTVLVELVAFGGFLCAASVVFADEFELQRNLLTERAPASDPDHPRESLTALLRLFEPAVKLLDEAMVLEAVEAGDNTERVVRWLAALNGVLLIDRASAADRHLLRAQHHGRELTTDLLVGWGGDRADVEVAASHVERLAALAPLAPPPEGPGFT